MLLTLNLNTNEITALTNLSVILPVFNGAEHLQETLLSIEKQSLKGIEIIAIDDGSSDLSVSLLGQVPALRLLHSKRTGPNVSRQMALSYARGSYIAFLDQDDLWHPEHLRLAVEALSSNPQATAWIGPRVRFTDSIKNLGKPATLPNTINPAEFFPINLIDTPSMIVIPKSKLLEVGGWPEDRPLGADTLLWWRLARSGPFLVGPIRTTGVRVRKGSMSAVHRQEPSKYLRFLEHSARTVVVQQSAMDNSEPLSTDRIEILRYIDQVLQAFQDTIPGTHTKLSYAWNNFAKQIDAKPEKEKIALLGFVGWALNTYLQTEAISKVASSIACILHMDKGISHSTRKLTAQMLASILNQSIITSLFRFPGLRSKALEIALLSTAYNLRLRIGYISDPISLFTNMNDSTSKS